MDATYARLYGLTRAELRYILDPKEVHGEDFPGETFRVLKNKEMRLYGEFRTRRLVLEAWDAMDGLKVEGWKVESATVISKQLSVNSAPPVVEKQEERSAPVAAPKPVEENPAQPMLSDFGLYKCQGCGKMVMGYNKGNHVREGHGGV